ncbi:MAG: ABC transporter ATP-binding protein [Clostridia bacterium]|nr:ABC transporter ATP-binding protein [Clostridia bacterium]
MKKWYKYIKPYLPAFILGPLCMIVEVIGEVVLPKLLGSIIDYGVSGKDAPEIVKFLYSIFGTGNGFIVAVMTGMILTAVLMMIGGVGGAWFGAKASVNFASDLRADVYKKVQQFSFANIDRFSTGSLVTRLTNDVTQMQNFINMLLRMALRSPGMLIGALIMAIVLNPTLTLILAVIMPLMIFVIFLVLRKSLPLFSSMQGKIDTLNSTIQENITNVRVVKSFVRQDFEQKKFSRDNGNLKNAGYEAMNLMIILSPAVTLFMNITTIAVYWFGGNMVIDGTMSPGDLTAFITYITQILSSLMMVTMLFMNMSRAMASAKRIGQVLDEKIDISDEFASDKDAKIEQGAIEFKNVSFRYYKTSQEKVLDSVSFTVEPETTLGIIGSTGCGKTTLVSLLPRLYDADEGKVLIDGKDVRDYSLKNLRDGVAVVLQKNVLFSGTIEDNLRWGNENATEEEIIKAAQFAQADKFVSSFPEKYQTQLDQGGTNVSGGQKQRLCIARALLKKPKILILDDSTSAVDTATEAQIRLAFETELKHSTKIIIAQRISSVMNADKIVVMDNGAVTGIGTHAELLENNKEYQEIYYSQMEKEAK